MPRRSLAKETPCQGEAVARRSLYKETPFQGRLKAVGLAGAARLFERREMNRPRDGAKLELLSYL